jgi:PiT family inorganic phosphate transporter
MSSDLLLQIAVGVTVAFAFVNGVHDGGNVIATIVCSGSVRPIRALVLASIAEFAGPLLMGVAVANTIASGILNPDLLVKMNAAEVYVLAIGGVGAAIVWKVPSWFVGLPSSGSHALIGGLVGAGLVSLGKAGVALDRLAMTVVAPLILSPVMGLISGFLLFSVIRSLFGRAHRSIAHMFRVLQEPTMFFLGASHGSNDAQKSMGVIAMILAAGSGQAAGSAALPEWVIFVCAAALALGLSAGGWRVVRTVGYGICKMEPVHSFASQLATSSIVTAASLMGGPVSTTQVISSSVMGVGSARRLSGVRWSAAATIAYTWLLVIPVCAGLGAGACWCLRRMLIP